MTREKLSQIRADAGRIGGLQTAIRHGSEHFSRIGKLHRLPSIEELLARQNQNEEGGKPAQARLRRVALNKRSIVEEVGVRRGGARAQAVI